ncbi:MAG: UDP-N-acetylmuramoyl-L-alanyl-D-glutamate--2,6-diaminopimelate ligase [Armatimonadota bacterium]
MRSCGVIIRGMQFSELRKKITGVRAAYGGDAQIRGIAYDSRCVEPGFVFVAMKGGTYDGHDFVSDALAAGASAVIAERPVECAIEAGVPCVLVDDGRRAMGEIAAPFFDYPSRELTLIGVTGTSGKTTVTHLIQSVFAAAGRKTGLIGTLGARVQGDFLSTKHTTPESVDLQQILRLMVDQGVEVVAMEVSSHGLYQGRVLGCEFDCGVFTNIARDHLDFHKTPEAYLDAKLMLFRDYPAMSQKRFVGVVNVDDHSAQAFIAAAPGPVVTFGVRSSADLTASDCVVTDRSVSFDLHYQGSTARVSLGIGGSFNVYNALAAAAVGVGLGTGLEAIVDGLRQARGVPGRFESVDCGQDFGVIVDYAHTPDELENVLRTARELTAGRLIVVFGCGGDRDRGKRPIMGRIAAELADLVVITSDNPRSEKPESIIDEILQGISGPDRNRVEVVVDRKEAIDNAIEKARKEDLVVIAGKGHEDYQIFADRTIHFDDREVAREKLCSLSKRVKS